jgi:hypothetical protein
VACGWSWWGYNKHWKTFEPIHIKGCLGQYKTMFDSEMLAIANMMGFVNQNEIRGNRTISSDAQVVIA